MTAYANSAEPLTDPTPPPPNPAALQPVGPQLAPGPPQTPPCPGMTSDSNPSLRASAPADPFPTLDTPLTFQPILQHRVWGGSILASRFHKPPLPQDQPTGESWEICDLESAVSTVSGGPLHGRPLDQLLQQASDQLLGTAKPFQNRFPLLIKFLDARENLSVQVHPSDAYARKANLPDVRVKHEAWYILHAEPDAGIYVDLRPQTTLDDLRQALRDNSTASLLQFHPVAPGQCYYLPSGTLHALGAGVVVAEVQTPSDTTFRLYDWGRRGRELHIQQALDSIDLSRPWAPQPPQAIHRPGAQTAWRLATCPYFNIDEITLPPNTSLGNPTGQLRVLLVAAGQAELLTEPAPNTAEHAPLRLAAGQTILLPSACRPTAVRTGQQGITLLDVTLA